MPRLVVVELTSFQPARADIVDYERRLVAAMSMRQPKLGALPDPGPPACALASGRICLDSSEPYKRDTIMVYNDQHNYGTWEFIFDPNKQKPVANPNGGAAGMPASQMGSQIGTPANQVGTPAGNSPLERAPLADSSRRGAGRGSSRVVGTGDWAAQFKGLHQGWAGGQ
jgi:hypothetical protein